MERELGRVVLKERDTGSGVKRSAAKEEEGEEEEEGNLRHGVKRGPNKY